MKVEAQDKNKKIQESLVPQKPWGKEMLQEESSQVELNGFRDPTRQRLEAAHMT